MYKIIIGEWINKINDQFIHHKNKQPINSQNLFEAD